jgi:uncharacterized protein YdaU (DUF1376 family)
MAISPMFPLWTDAYLGDTRHLSTLEHGAYMLLLITAWRSKDGLLPDDDKLLSRYAGLTIDKWRKIRPILEPFFCIENGVWAQGRLLDERKADFDFRKSQSKKAKARHLKNKETTHAAASCGHMPPPTPTPTPITNKLVIKKVTKKVLKKPPDITDQIWNDFLTLRKAKKAPVTETVLKKINIEAMKLGWTTTQAMEHMIARGHQGFQAQWIINEREKEKRNGTHKKTHREYAQEYLEEMYGPEFDSPANSGEIDDIIGVDYKVL